MHPVFHVVPAFDYAALILKICCLYGIKVKNQAEAVCNTCNKETFIMCW